jgi:transposase
MDINQIYKNIILKIVEERCPTKRKHKYSNEYYFDMMIHVLRDVTSWKALGRLHKGKAYHYKTIHGKYLQWCRLNIFEDAYLTGIRKITQRYSCHSTIDLFIDGTLINNKYGRELTAYGRNKKKKVTNVSVICNENKLPLSVTFYKGSTHDIKTMNESIDKLNKIIKYRKVNLIADKGYISKAKQEELIKQKIQLIFPYRKNQKKRNTKREKTKIKKRQVVEHANQKMKDYNRVYIRRDHLIVTYKGFVYMALGHKFVT